MSSVETEGTDALLDLYGVMSDESRSFEAKIEDALALGAEYLGVENAHLTRIAPEIDYWEAIVSTDDPDGEYPPGLVLDFQTTYCRRVLDEDESIVLHDAPAQGWADDPAFDAHDLHCYHGTPVRVHGEVFGTVCFVSKAPRDEPFSEAETLFAELLARLVEHELAVEQYETETQRRANTVTVLSRVLRHNLRNEMTILRGKIGQLARNADRATGENDERAGGDPPAATADVAVTEIYETIDEIISLSDKARKLETVISTQFERQTVALEPLLDRVITDVSLDAAGATIDVDGAANVTVEARESLQLAIRELVENAVKHGGDPPTVTVEVTEREETVELAVSDDGPGLPEQERAVLSEGVETPLVHGSGLGLWMVYWIVTNHDGEIDAAVGDDGTTITVSLPRAASTPQGSEGESVRELQRGLDRFEAVFQESFDAMVLVDDDQRVVDANEQASDMLGVPESDLLGRSFEQFVADAEDFAARWLELQATGTHEGEIRLRRAGGGERIVEYSASADVVPGQHLLIGRDVTERRERERQFDVIFNQAFQFTGLLAPDGTVLEINDTALEFVDAAREAIVGRQLWELPAFQHGDAPARTRAAFDRATDGAFVREEVDGAERTIPIDFSLKPVCDEDGAVELVIAEGRDISDLKETERELRENRQRLAAIVAASPDPILAIDESGTIELWNEAAEDVLGYDADDVVGEPLTEVGMHASGQEADVADRFERALDGESFTDLRVTRRREDGSETSLSISTAPIRGEDGAVEGVMGIMKPLDRGGSHDADGT
jgi:PAS domain S-box-containing protein